MENFRSKFVLDVNILLDFILEREEYKNVSKVVEYLVKNRNGFISSSSLPILYYVVFKYRRKIFSFLPQILKNFIIWKTPSYIDWNHPLAQKDIEDYLIHLTAESLNAFVITRDAEFLELSDRAVTIEEFFKIILKEREEKRISFLNLPSQVSKIYPKVEKNWDNILANASFICGKHVKKFEEKFADYLGARFCIGVNSGTSALMVALMAIGLKPGDEVIMPVNTFIATAEAVSILGGKPVFVDIHPEYYTIDVTEIEDKITERTKAIIPVHLYGQCADMDPIMEISHKHNLWVIEDACQAHGAEYKGRKAGTIGHIGCFSFYPGKNLGAWGEGGACVTDDRELADRMYKIRNHGEVRKYQHEILGGNFRMEELQGAVLYEKLKYLDKWNEKRIEIAHLYKENLEILEEQGFIKLPAIASYNTRHVYHLYVIQMLKKDRNELISYFQKFGIDYGIHYPLPLHLNQVYRDLYKNNLFPAAEKIQKRIISLPIGEHLQVENVEKISKTIKNFFDFY